MDLKMEKEQQLEAWSVTPTPGYVLKFTEVDMKHVYGEIDEHRCFLNICHCEQLPPPTEDIDEDELAARIDNGDVGYRIPVSIGELDSVVDSKNRNQPKIFDYSRASYVMDFIVSEQALPSRNIGIFVTIIDFFSAIEIAMIKVDVLVNSLFYEKRLAPPGANFFRHFFCMVVCDAIEDKHHLKLDPNKCVKLRNRTVMGIIEPMRIAKRPVTPVIREITSPTMSSDVQPLKFTDIEQPECVRMRLHKGSRLEIELWLKGVELKDTRRLRLCVNRDRVVLLADKTKSLFDFCVPFCMDSASVQQKLHFDLSKITFSVHVFFP